MIIQLIPGSNAVMAWTAGRGVHHNTVELRSRSASLCRLNTRFVSAAKGCRPTIWYVSVLNSTVLGVHHG